MLAVFFLLTGLACVGFPGTVGFISTELLVDSVVEANLYVGVGVLIASALNGIAVLRAYLLLFTGGRHVSSVAVGIGARERFAVLSLSALILTTGVFPQPGVTTREQAAVEILKDRARHRLAPPEATARVVGGRGASLPHDGPWPLKTLHNFQHRLTIALPIGWRTASAIQSGKTLTD
jgi:NADH-quinone oxidoreductase subunit M